jgi:addiction module HigA family antidote
MKLLAEPELRLLHEAVGRREPVEHPGLTLQREYLDPLGLDAASLAERLGMDRHRLQRILEGSEPLDCATSIRLARSLQLNPSHLMELQLRHDFAVLRTDDSLNSVPLLRDEGRVAFPGPPFLSGFLSGLRENWGWGEARPETMAFIADGDDAGYLTGRVHDIEQGAWLRVYDPAGRVEWAGILLSTLDGKPLLPYVRPSTWIEWFLERRRADFVPAP